MKLGLSVAAALLVALSSGVAGAQEEAPVGRSSAGWALGGGALGSGNTLHGEFGWPGIGATFLHSYTPKVDLGGRFFFLYGFEGLTRTGATPGLRFDFALRLNIVQQGKVDFGIRFNPGLVMYFPSSSVVDFGLGMPLEFALGLHLTPEFLMQIGLEFPMTLFLSPGVSFFFPIRPEAGFEYRVDRSLSLTFEASVGPTLGTNFFFRGNPVGFKALFGAAYHF